jgi:hypothetical protein
MTGRSYMMGGKTLTPLKEWSYTYVTANRERGTKEEASSSILLMSEKEPLEEEENMQYYNMRIGEINISLEMNFRDAHVCEEVMQKTSKEEAKEPKVFETNSLCVIAGATKRWSLETVKRGGEWIEVKLCSQGRKGKGNLHSGEPEK